MGRTAVAPEPDDAMGNGPDDGTGKEAKGFLCLQGRDFTPERSSAHVVGFRPPPVTHRVVQNTGAMLLPMGQQRWGKIEGISADLAQQQCSSHCNRHNGSLGSSDVEQGQALSGPAGNSPPGTTQLSV